LINPAKYGESVSASSSKRKSKFLGTRWFSKNQRGLHRHGRFEHAHNDGDELHIHNVSTVSWKNNHERYHKRGAGWIDGRSGGSIDMGAVIPPRSSDGLECGDVIFVPVEYDYKDGWDLTRGIVDVIFKMAITTGVITSIN